MTDRLAIPVYLASTSPRRRDLLTQMGYAVHILTAPIDETAHMDEAAADYVQRMAVEKNRAAQQLWRQNHHHEPEYPIISADTTVTLNRLILGKPASPAHAAAMLRQLSGQIHQVLSAVCVFWRGREYRILQKSDVLFAPLTPAVIAAYVASGEPMDKAGAYGIQGLGGTLVAHLSGSFTGVMGLPVFETGQLLHNAGWPAPPWAEAPATSRAASAHPSDNERPPAR